jgi:hypothetical protein
LTGRINGKSIQGSGKGLLASHDGIVDGEYALKRLPTGFSPLVLNAVMVTGYPSICKASEGVENPFKLGEYRYVRAIDLGEFGGFEYSAECEESLDDQGILALESRFALIGEINVPELVRCAPLVETWVPAGPGHVDGYFTIVWAAADGSFVTGHAKTKYDLPAGRHTSEILHRWIKLTNPSWSKTELEIYQESRLTKAVH